MSSPLLSVIVLAWDQLDHTTRCVDSLRAHTDVPYELIVVDNGSSSEAAEYAEAAGDVSILNPDNRGFAVGMNQGLEAASGEHVAFVNNDTVFAADWASTLVADFVSHGGAGIVLPAVTAAGNPVSVREAPGPEILVLPRFRCLPSGVVYVMRTSVARLLGGFSEEYPVASSEDLDLLFKVWSNGLDVVLDERVLVDHVSAATAATQLDDMDRLWRSNRLVFASKWARVTSGETPRLEWCLPSVHEALLVEARIAATWMKRAFTAEDALRGAERAAEKVRRAGVRASEEAARWRDAHSRRLGPRLQRRLRRAVGRALPTSRSREP